MRNEPKMIIFEKVFKYDYLNKSLIDSKILHQSKTFRFLYLHCFNIRKLKTFVYTIKRRARRSFFKRGFRSFKRIKIKRLWRKVRKFLKYKKIQNFLKHKSLRLKGLFLLLSYRARYYKKIKTALTLSKFNIDLFWRKFEVKNRKKSAFYFDKEFLIYANDFIDNFDFKDFLACRRQVTFKAEYKLTKRFRTFSKFIRSVSVDRFFNKFHKDFWFRKNYHNFKDFKFSVYYKYYVEYKSWSIYALNQKLGRPQSPAEIVLSPLFKRPLLKYFTKKYTNYLFKPVKPFLNYFLNWYIQYYPKYFENNNKRKFFDFLYNDWYERKRANKLKRKIKLPLFYEFERRRFTSYFYKFFFINFLKIKKPYKNSFLVIKAKLYSLNLVFTSLVLYYNKLKMLLEHFNNFVYYYDYSLYTKKLLNKNLINVYRLVLLKKNFKFKIYRRKCRRALWKFIKFLSTWRYAYLKWKRRCLIKKLKKLKKFKRLKQLKKIYIRKIVRKIR